MMSDQGRGQSSNGILFFFLFLFIYLFIYYYFLYQLRIF